MIKNFFNNFNNKNIDIDAISKKIFDSIYDIAHYIEFCNKCNSKNISIIQEENKLYKCSDCSHTFSPKINSMYQKIRLNEEKLFYFIKSMLLDSSIEDLCRKLVLSSDSVNKKWELIYNFVNWNSYNISIREKPSKNIYGNFEVIIG